ncbi:MAG: class D sortase [Acidobacteria bacterium]|nr:class D sortase [Acidobacteriota bacterium]
MRRSTPRHGSVRRVLAVVCLAVGAALLAYALWSRYEGAAYQAGAIERFERARAAVTPRPTAPEPAPTRSLEAPQEPPDDLDVSLWAPKRVALFRESFSERLEVPLALLEIPRLGIRVGVLDGVDDLRLNRGVGRIPGTAAPGEPGNVAIAGHRDGFFRGLKDIAIGDELRLETAAGVVRFAVEWTRVVEPEEVSVLDPTSEPAVTLVTCYPFYFVGSAPQRFIVRAHRVRPGEPTAADVRSDRAPDSSRPGTLPETQSPRPSVAVNDAGGTGTKGRIE